MRVTSAISLVLLAMASSGCASAGFHPVAFAGETSTAGSAPPNGQSVHVVRNVAMKDTLIEAKIRYKLEEFLLTRGYTLAAAEKADIYVLATFGAGERIVASTAPVIRGAEVRVERDREGRPTRRIFLPDRMEYLRVPLVKNSVWLQVLSSDARHYRETGQIKNLWRGESAIVGPPDALESSAPFLLVPALRYFGKSTPDIVTVDVFARDAAWK